MTPEQFNRWLKIQHDQAIALEKIAQLLETRLLSNKAAKIIKKLK